MEEISVSARTKQIVVLTLVLYVVWIVAGSMGLLPSIGDTYLGDSMSRSHSIFIIVPIFIDIAIYVLLTPVLIAMVLAFYDSIRSKLRS